MEKEKEKEKEQGVDAELLRLALGGDADAFGSLYDRWSGVVYRFAWRLSGDQSLAEDVTHDLFMSLLRDGSQYEGRGKFSSYLLSITRHLVLHRLKRDRRFCPLDLKDEEFDQLPVDPTADPLQELSRAEATAKVRQAILGLPFHYREVVLLCYLHELSYAEAAEVIGCAIGTVCSRLSRARELLAKRLRPADGSPPSLGEEYRLAVGMKWGGR